MTKTTGNKQWVLKLERYCAWQDRCEAEVKTKMQQLEIPAAERVALLEHLYDEGYLDDVRYATHFATGKFRIKKWGRIKIRHALAGRSIPEKLIDSGLKAINADEYEQVLRQILSEKRKALPKVSDPYELNHKVSIYAINKGYEPDLVWEILKETRSIK